MYHLMSSHNCTIFFPTCAFFSDERTLATDQATDV